MRTTSVQLEEKPLLNGSDHEALPEPVYGYYIEIIPVQGSVYHLTLLKDTPILVGRSRNYCQLLLGDGRVSRVHLQITYTDQQQITVTDMHSANGSRLDGRALQPGMPITWLINQPLVIGDTHLILRYGALGD